MASRTVAFTASRHLDAGGERLVTSVLTVHVPPADRYVTGGCEGGDAFIGRWLYYRYPDAEHVIVVPANRSRVDYWWESVDGKPVTLIEMPAGTTYADRNARLVAEAEGGVVFAFPLHPEHDPRSQRSGTWQTKRMAEHVGNLSMWHLVSPPYTGRIERRPEELLGEVLEDDRSCE